MAAATVNIKGFNFSGLYAITDQALHADDITAPVIRAMEGGARVIQYRDKSSPDTIREQQSRALLRICREQRTALLINDDVDLAAHIGADGVHIGKEDGGLAAARRRLGKQAIIGVSCYNQPQLALQAQAEGADYVAFGRFFVSASKPEAVQADIQMLREVRRQIHTPIVAIGGITAQNGRPLIDAGADMLAVIRGVFGADDVRNAAAELHTLFDFPEAS